MEEECFISNLEPENKLSEMMCLGERRIMMKYENGARTNEESGDNE